MKLVLAFALASSTSVLAAEWDIGLKPFLELHCYDCHGDGAKKGGLAMDELTYELDDPAVFAKWERIYDRALNGEMPPKKIKERPTVDELQNLKLRLEPVLASAHEKAKGTVLRRLNRREYQNAMNDLFGTDLKLEGMLPEDGRSHEFDVVGEALGVSMTHLRPLIEAAGLVFDAAVAKTTEAPQPKLIEAKFSESTLKQVVGDRWVRAKDGAIVRFSEGGYPSGHLREGRIREPGLYRIRVTGYAYQSVDPLPVYFSAISYTPGSEKPILGFASIPTWQADHNRKDGVARAQPNAGGRTLRHSGRRQLHFTQKTGESIHDYKGPGFAFLSATMEGPIIEEFPSRGHKLIFGNLVRREIEPATPRTRKNLGTRPSSRSSRRTNPPMPPKRSSAWPPTPSVGP